jgi:cation diffusion facilitator family transporter
LSEKKFIALTSVAAAVFLTGFKLLVGIWTNSLGILSEAAHSGLDLLAAIITLLAVTFADRPADEEHQYGHGKFENISALFETILLFITCGWIIYEALERFFTHAHHVEPSVWGFVVMGTSIIVDFSRSRALYKAARKHNSQALEADALHFSSDIWSSLTVIAGLFFVYIGYPEFDSLAALVVAMLVLFVSYRLGRRTIDALMDRVPRETTRKIKTAIRSVEGVEELRSVRTRLSGPRMFIDTIVAIRRTLSFQEAHDIMDRVEQAVQAVQQNADVVVHGEPFESADESVSDKIRMIVINNGMRPPHNLNVNAADNPLLRRSGEGGVGKGFEYHVDFDLEYPHGLSFSQAHNIASEIEQQIYKELPVVRNVTIHMEEHEPEPERPGEAQDVTESEISLVQKIRKHVEKNKEISSCKNITLLQEGNRYNVALICRLPQTKTLGEVHRIISEVESYLYREFKLLRRITIHAEPE